MDDVIVQESKVMEIGLTFQPTDVLPSHMYHLLSTFPKIYIYGGTKLNEKTDLGITSLLVQFKGKKNLPKPFQVLFVNIFGCVSTLILTPPLLSLVRVPPSIPHSFPHPHKLTVSK